MPRSPRRRIRLATVIGELAALRSPVGLKTSVNLTPATGVRTTWFCRPRPSFVEELRWHVHIRRSLSEDRDSAVRLRAVYGSQASLPCHRRHATALSRPPHPIPTFVTIAKRPSCGTGRYDKGN